MIKKLFKYFPHKFFLLSISNYKMFRFFIQIAFIQTQYIYLGVQQKVYTQKSQNVPQIGVEEAVFSIIIIMVVICLYRDVYVDSINFRILLHQASCMTKTGEWISIFPYIKIVLYMDVHVHIANQACPGSLVIEVKMATS